MMRAYLKSEIRKLLSVRMTYIVTAIGFAITGGLMSFYSMGINDSRAGSEHPQYLESVILNNANFMALFIAIVALLMITHEYRYNTITYTLTGSNSRTKSFLAKMLVIGGFSLIVTSFVSASGPLLTLLGMRIEGVEFAVPQPIPYLEVAWRCLFYGFGTALFAAIIAFIIRNQVGAIVTFFIIINTVEGALGILLDENVKYLPFTALQYVINVTFREGPGGESAVAPLWSPNEAALLFSAYLLLGGFIAWMLFLRRDATAN